MSGFEKLDVRAFAGTVAFLRQCGASRPLQNSSSRAYQPMSRSRVRPRPIFLDSHGGRDIIVEPTGLVPFDQIFDGSDVACGVVNPATVTHSDLVAEVLKLETRLCFYCRPAAKR